MNKLINIARDTTTNKLIYFIWASLFLFSVQTRAEIFKASIFELEVTQKNVGYYEVDEKAKNMKNMSESERKAYILSEPIPVVMGPHGKMYMVDHHHLARAVYETDHQTVYVQPFLDLSLLAIDDFWKEMIKRKLTYLKDLGKTISYKDLPKNIKNTGDDVYRSLAGQVRKAGGYDKTTIPFAEFQWADFFRTRIKIGSSHQSYQKAIKEARQLAQSVYAKDLPGHVSARNKLSCADVL